MYMRSMEAFIAITVKNAENSTMRHVKNSKGVPHCEVWRSDQPDVVLYEESLDENMIDKSIRAISQADTLIMGGTSLVVYPAA